MNKDSILDEVYAARRALWEESGGTLSGLGAFLRANPVPGVRYAKLPMAKPRRILRAAPRLGHGGITKKRGKACCQA